MSTAPALTWLQDAGYQFPSDPTSPADLITAISAAATAAPELTVLDGDANSVMIAPASGPLAGSLRYLFGVSASGPNSGQVAHETATQGNYLYCGFSPDSGASSLTNGWDSASNPFGAARFSKLFKCSGSVTGGSTTRPDRLYMVRSAEGLALFCRSDNGDRWRAGVLGAIMDPVFDVAGERFGNPAAGAGRLYGMFSNGSDDINDSFWSSVTKFGGRDSAAHGPKFGVFSPDNVGAFGKVKRDWTWASGGAGLVDHIGNRIYPRGVYRRDGGSGEALGYLRGICIAGDVVGRTPIQDDQARDLGVIFSGSLTVPADGLAFYNLGVA